MSKKAAAYSEAKMVLEQHLARTGEVLSVRQLRSQCGDAGSLDTFQKYLIKWKAELASGKCLMSTIMALKHQLQANYQISQALLDQMLRAASAQHPSYDSAAKDPDGFPDEGANDIEALDMQAASFEQEAAEDVIAVSIADAGASELASENEAVDARPLQADLFIETLADGFAANAVARFIADETPATELGGDGDSEISLDTSCSRAPAGSQHAAQQEGTDQPDQGEHDTLKTTGQIATVHERGEQRETGRLIDTNLASPNPFGEHAREFGSSTQARPIEDGTRACDPRAENSDEPNQENSCSRNVRGSQHAALWDDANQPEKGEHDTISGSCHDAV